MSNGLADELHKTIRRKFVFASGVGATWAADLVEMQPFPKQNGGYKYILMIIDVFSKYSWTIPLKIKTVLEVTNAFQHFFYNKSMKDMLHKHNVNLYSTENEETFSIVERWNRTIKQNMWKYFSANNTMNYFI